MAKLEIPEITEVQRISLQPGDKVAVRVPGTVSHHSADLTKEHVAAVLGLDRGSVLVLGSGLSLEVVTP